MIDLETLRTDRNSWENVAFAPSHTEERGTFDRNSRARFQVLLAIQYDRQDSDLGLIRYLFTNEIIAAENDSFQGFGRALTLAACLLARFRNPSDLELFARAKVANFDTYCGFPLEFMLIVGGEQTACYLEQIRPELRAKLDDFDFTMRDGLKEWWRTISDEYPDTVEKEPLLTLYERALAFEDTALARQYLEQWRLQEPDSDAKWRTLKYNYEQLGDWKRSAEIATIILDRSKTLWDKASALQDLINSLRQSGAFSQSLGKSRQLDMTFTAFDDWIGAGLGRMAIHEVFELSLSHPDAAEATQAFALADSWYQRSHDLALVGIEAGARAARRCGLLDKAMEYEHIAAREQERIDKLTKRIKLS